MTIPTVPALPALPPLPHVAVVDINTGPLPALPVAHNERSLLVARARQLILNPKEKISWDERGEIVAALYVLMKELQCK